MLCKTTLIFLPLLLLVGVASTFSVLREEDGDVMQPFVSTSRKRRICVELCLSGLGGNSCGDQCYDITPLDLPMQSSLDSNSGTISDNITREAACSVLCENKLGYPLCKCDDLVDGNVKNRDEPDFLQICSFFCLTYDYQLNGCQKCKIYETFPKKKILNSYTSLFTKFDTAVDWKAWCQNQCSKGTGGAACNCDRLPL